MDLVQIRYFLALAEALNFTRAAELCNVTQPALTKSIQRLEDEMGGPLLLRERRLTQLTELGQRLLPALRQTFEAAQNARRLAKDYRKEERSHLRLAFDQSIDASCLRPILRELARRLARFELTLRQASLGEIKEMLLHGQVDLCLSTDGEALKERTSQWALFDDPVVALFPAGHELADEAGPIDSTALGAHLAVGHVEDEMPLERIRTRLAAGGERGDGQRLHRCTTAGQVNDLVLTGLGIGLSTARQPCRPGLASRELAPAEHLTVAVATVAGRPLPRTADLFLKLARARDWSVEVPAQA